jgi:hypothetical protein
MGVSGHRHAPTALYSVEMTPGTHCVRGWKSFRAGLDTEAKGRILYLCRGLNRGHSVCSQILYWLVYRSSRLQSQEVLFSIKLVSESECNKYTPFYNMFIFGKTSHLVQELKVHHLWCHWTRFWATHIHLSASQLIPLISMLMPSTHLLILIWYFATDGDFFDQLSSFHEGLSVDGINEHVTKCYARFQTLNRFSATL